MTGKRRMRFEMCKMRWSCSEAVATQRLAAGATALQLCLLCDSRCQSVRSCRARMGPDATPISAAFDNLDKMCIHHRIAAQLIAPYASKSYSSLASFLSVFYVGTEKYFSDNWASRPPAAATTQPVVPTSSDHRRTIKLPPLG